MVTIEVAWVIVAIFVQVHKMKRVVVNIYAAFAGRGSVQLDGPAPQSAWQGLEKFLSAFTRSA
jgi:hypothetical protein